MVALGKRAKGPFLSFLQWGSRKRTVVTNAESNCRSSYIPEMALTWVEACLPCKQWSLAGLGEGWRYLRLAVMQSAHVSYLYHPIPSLKRQWHAENPKQHHSVCQQDLLGFAGAGSNVSRVFILNHLIVQLRGYQISWEMPKKTLSGNKSNKFWFIIKAVLQAFDGFKTCHLWQGDIETEYHPPDKDVVFWSYQKLGGLLLLTWLATWECFLESVHWENLRTLKMRNAISPSKLLSCSLSLDCHILPCLHWGGNPLCLIYSSQGQSNSYMFKNATKLHWLLLQKSNFSSSSSNNKKTCCFSAGQSVPLHFQTCLKCSWVLMRGGGRTSGMEL